MICAQSQSRISIQDQIGRPRNLFSRAHPQKAAPTGLNLEKLERTNQEGRIPRRAVARATFCYRSLQETLSILPSSFDVGNRLLPLYYFRPQFRRLFQNINASTGMQEFFLKN